MLNYETLVEKFRGGMKLYVEYGVPPGSFLRAVLENDLVEACSRADDESMVQLLDLVGWMYNELPPRSTGLWGSREAVAAYIEKWSTYRARNAIENEVIERLVTKIEANIATKLDERATSEEKED